MCCVWISATTIPRFCYICLFMVAVLNQQCAVIPTLIKFLVSSKIPRNRQQLQTTTIHTQSELLPHPQRWKPGSGSLIQTICSKLCSSEQASAMIVPVESLEINSVWSQGNNQKTSAAAFGSTVCVAGGKTALKSLVQITGKHGNRSQNLINKWTAEVWTEFFGVIKRHFWWYQEKK